MAVMQLRIMIDGQKCYTYEGKYVEELMDIFSSMISIDNKLYQCVSLHMLAIRGSTIEAIRLTQEHGDVTFHEAWVFDVRPLPGRAEVMSRNLQHYTVEPPIAVPEDEVHFTAALDDIREKLHALQMTGGT